MVHWAASYFVGPKVILGWVNYLQGLKKKGDLPKELWVTSSDNFASWGGGGPEYHNADLNDLIKAVDYLSVHTYPFHDTHYNPAFWQRDLNAVKSPNEALMNDALAYSQNQFQQVANYLKDIGVEKPLHIGETGWASSSDGLYGPEGSRAADAKYALWPLVDQGVFKGLTRAGQSIKKTYDGNEELLSEDVFVLGIETQPHSMQ
jgi:hypothetical protein